MILHLPLPRPLPVHAVTSTDADIEWTAIQWLLFGLDMAGLRLARASEWHSQP